MSIAYVAHPSAVIDDGAEIGAGTTIWHFSHIMAGCTIGSNCNIGQNVVILPGVILGNNVKSAKQCITLHRRYLRRRCIPRPLMRFYKCHQSAQRHPAQNTIHANTPAQRRNHWRQCHYYLWQHNRHFCIHWRRRSGNQKRSAIFTRAR